MKPLTRHCLASALAFLATPCRFALAAVDAGVDAAAPSVIYGQDDRKDLYEVDDPDIRSLADSTVALIWEGHVLHGKAMQQRPGATHDDLVPIGDEWWSLWPMTFGEHFNICRSERFWDQPMNSYCSGALVGPDLVLTAGHCLRSQKECDQMEVVFGYDVKEAGRYPSLIPASEVYGCKAIVKRAEPAHYFTVGPIPLGVTADIELIRLDRPVEGHRPLRVDRGARLEKGTPLLMIGHPMGLPTKVAGLSGAARVQDAGAGELFWSNLDAFKGNSGSPVFNAETKLIEGVMSDELDRDWDDSGLPRWTDNLPLPGVLQGIHEPQPGGACFKTHVVRSDGSGIGVTKVGILADQVPEVEENAGGIPQQAGGPEDAPDE